MTDLFCPVRKSWCKPLPEEKVRISLLHQMIHRLNFPLETIGVEKELKHLPHLMAGQALPERRADIICFAKGIHPAIDFYPLLLVECKAVKLTDKVLGQVMGYNHFVQAYFICIANHKEVRTGWQTAQGDYQFVNYLPSCIELKSSIVL